MEVKKQLNAYFTTLLSMQSNIEKKNQLFKDQPINLSISTIIMKKKTNAITIP